MAALLALTLLCRIDAHAQPPSGASAAANTAARAMSEHRYDEAAGIYSGLLKAHPDEPGLLANFGIALALGGHEADAVAPLERALVLNPKLTNARMFLGSSYLAIGETKKAIAALKQVRSEQPSSTENRRMLAEAYAGDGRAGDALAEMRGITELAPRNPEGWFALGHAYNGVAQDAMATFNDNPDDLPWRQLLLADALAEDGRLTDAFALYRTTLERLPSMVSIHDSVARIYEQTAHADWAALERSKGILQPSQCTTRQLLCDFRAGRYRTALTTALARTDPEARYWQARAAAELARDAFRHLETLPDSRERRQVRAALARGKRRYNDAIVDLQAALKMAPGDPGLLADLGTTYHFARDFERTVATLLPLLKAGADDPQLLSICGDALLQLQRVDEAIPLLERATTLDPADSTARLALAAAFLQKEDFAAAVTLLQVELTDDQDGSVHVKLARAYKGLGNNDKAAELLARSAQLQRAAQERNAAKGQRTITPPK